MNVDMYWISDLALGRLAIVGRPRCGDWLADEISAWKAAGLTDVVSLLEDHEIRELELEEEDNICVRVGLLFERFPIPDRGVPASADAAIRLCDGIATKIAKGQSVGVHCRAGIGRSGLIAAGVLLRLGTSEEDAWQRVSKARGLRVPDTDEQRTWLSKMFARQHTP
jgi:protein-tyrosine phosphatase